MSILDPEVLNYGLGGVLYSAAGPPALAGAMKLLLRRRPYRYSFTYGWGMSGIGGASGYVFHGHHWLEAGLCAANAVAAYLWWLWNRRRKRRAPKLAGAKSRALLAAIVRKAREAAKPKPVLRPAPGGAR